jgi:hypothetical protein
MSLIADILLALSNSLLVGVEIKVTESIILAHFKIDMLIAFVAKI